eukprot:365646-Chlamydomonas_euryale.AAC.4
MTGTPSHTCSPPNLVPSTPLNRYKPKGGALAEPIRYKDWYPEECHARECLQPQGSADLVVDVAAVVAMLDAKLPRVRAGESVEALKEPWPVAV